MLELRLCGRWNFFLVGYRNVASNAKVIKVRPDLTPIWRGSDAALCSREPGEFQVSMGEPRLH